MSNSLCRKRLANENEKYKNFVLITSAVAEILPLEIGEMSLLMMFVKVCHAVTTVQLNFNHQILFLSM